jgi:hypothetical protein
MNKNLLTFSLDFDPDPHLDPDQHLSIRLDLGPHIMYAYPEHCINPKESLLVNFLVDEYTFKSFFCQTKNFRKKFVRNFTSVRIRTFL